MSGGGGGGGGGGMPMGPTPEMEDVPQAKLQTSGWGGMGYTPVPQSFVRESRPLWMSPERYAAPQQFGYVPGQQNWFAAPWWGRDAVTNNWLGQGDLMAQQYVPPPRPERKPVEKEPERPQVPYQPRKSTGLVQEGEQGPWSQFSHGY